MTNKQRALLAISALEQAYPQAQCSLDYTEPLHLLIATRLSAQCTDARVNMVTPALFARFPTAADFAEAELSEVEQLIRTCGLYKTKAKDIIALCRMIGERYNGAVPHTLEQLLTLPGIGRKTANLVMGDVYHQPAIVCDTHCIRITGRLGLVSSKDAGRVEEQLRPLLPPDQSSDFCHRLVLHGRAVCRARSPLCGCCVMADFCKGRS